MNSDKSENIKNSFTTVCSFSDQIRSIQIKEVDMLGWTLFECFILPETIVYFSQDDVDDTIEHIDMGDEVPDEWREILLRLIKDVNNNNNVKLAS